MMNFQKKIIKRKKNNSSIIISSRSLYTFHSFIIFLNRMKDKINIRVFLVLLYISIIENNNIKNNISFALYIIAKILICLNKEFILILISHKLI